MNEDKKLCIICCLPFLSNKKSENVEKINKLCEWIKNDVDRNICGDSVEIKRLNKLNFQNEILKLEQNLGLSICIMCSAEITKLISSEENMTFLENHVISLQKEIIKGLKDLEDCMGKIKCLRENIKRKVEDSNDSYLKTKLYTERESNCLVFNLRKWIVKGKL